VRIRTPSISNSSVLCPNHVTRRPLTGGDFQRDTGLSTGSGDAGTRFFPPKKNSRNSESEGPPDMGRIG
jgi:hypothetical protein